jgi:hypothetical protein
MSMTLLSPLASPSSLKFESPEIFVGSTNMATKPSRLDSNYVPQ